MIPPYGGPLVELLVDDVRAAEMKATAKDYPSLTLDDRTLCDLELLAVGGLSPLRGFLGKADYIRVVAEQRLADGTLWPLPVTLSVPDDVRSTEGKPVALRDVYGNLLAFLHIEERYTFDKEAEAHAVYGTTNERHPGVAYLNRLPAHRAAGRLEVLRTPPHFDFVDIRRTPRALRAHFQSLGWTTIVAYSPQNVLYRPHEAAIKRAVGQVGGGLLFHPVVGVTKPGDVDHFTRVRCYRALVDNQDERGSVTLNLLPTVMRMAGPREALFHAIVQRNHGCTHLLVDPNYADPGDEVRGEPFHPTHAAQEAMQQHQDELGIHGVALTPMVYVADESRFASIDEVPAGATTADLSAAEIRDDFLAKGIPLPSWFAQPAIALILNETHPPKFRQGLTIWFTGLSGSGKSTVAHALVERLAEFGRNVSMLDGDEIRTHLSKGLGFSKEDRDANINRVGYVAGLVAQHGGTTLCAVISPYRHTRENARRASKGRFVEVFCDTPIGVCESRDVKGLYAKARAGEIQGFTGVDDPYEPPLNPEVTIDTSTSSVHECVDRIIETLLSLGYILPHGHITK